MADAAPSRASTQTAPRLRRDQASKHAHVRHRANLEVGLGRMLAVAEMQLRATAATNDDLGDALAEDRRRLLDAALCALAEARALGEPSEAAKRRRRGAAPPWPRRRRPPAPGRTSCAARRRASTRCWGAPARRLRRVYFKNLRYGPATPPRPRRVHGCVEFIVDGVVRASSVAAFGDAGSRGCSVHVFAPPVPFKTKADRVGGNVTYDGFHQPVVIQDFEVRALAVADRYACSWTGHSDERREWQQIHAVDDRDEPRPCDCFESLRPGKRRKIVGDEPYFDSMLAVLETRVPVDKDCSVCAIYRSLCDTRGEKRRSDLTTVFLMRKDRTQEDAHVFELHAALLARTSWDYSDETGGLFSYGDPDPKDADAYADAFWRESWRPNARGPRAPGASTA
ncbi:hypothetical protein JL721_3090 [Aureococcus anophagefferens]|nr:hypothetical protein JL721_3090 [Aureococcus anophagefferens]